MLNAAEVLLSLKVSGSQYIYILCDTGKNAAAGVHLFQLSSFFNGLSILYMNGQHVSVVGGVALFL